MLVLEWKERAFTEKVNSRCFCWFPAAILVHQNGTPIWRLHAMLYKGAWDVSANNSETVGHKDLGLGQFVFILVFYNISLSCLLLLDSFQFIFFVAWQWNRSVGLYKDMVNGNAVYRASPQFFMKIIADCRVTGGLFKDFTRAGWHSVQKWAIAH